MLLDKMSETCTTAYKAFEARVAAMGQGYQIKRFRCNNGRGEYDNKTFRSVLTTSGTTYEPCPPYSHHKNGVAERMIRTITEKARAMMIDSQAPVQFGGEAVNPAVYLHQRSPNEGLTKRDVRDGHKAPYETPYEMLHAFGKPAHDKAGNEISYKAPIHHLRRFGCYVSKLIPEAQCRSKFGHQSKPCMMVGYTHDSTTLCRIWDPNFQVVRAQSEVIFDEERNAYVSCTTDGIDIFGLPENAEYIEELHTGDGLLRTQNTAIGTDGDGLFRTQNTTIGTGGDGLLHGRPKDISGTGEGHRGGDHGHTDDVTDVHWHLPDDHTHRSLPARTGSRSYPPDEGYTIILAHSRDHSMR
jgi:hypothetical protein